VKPKPWHGLKVRWEWGIHALDLEVDASPDALPPTFFKFGVLRKEIYDKDKDLVQPESMRPAPHGLFYKALTVLGETTAHLCRLINAA